MTGYLVPVSKAGKKKGSGAQSRTQAATAEEIKNPGAPVKMEVHGPPPPPHPVPPGTPYNKISERSLKWANPKLILGGTAALGAAGTGAYLYRRRRVEKSLSLMQHDYPSVMMRTL